MSHTRTITTRSRTRRGGRARGLLVLLALLLASAAALAQTPTFTPLLTGHRVSAALAHDGQLYAGLAKGGVVVWDPATASEVRTLDRGRGLGGHFVTDLAWTGARLWIATADGGLTALTDPGSPQETLRPYSSALSSLDITAVAGAVVGGSERVYYGTDGDGIGAIVSGLPGAYYTTVDGLIDDVVVDLALADDLLLVATPSGISRFADNAFTSYPYDDPAAEAVRDLEVGPDGAIWAATPSAIQRWDDTARQWVAIAGTGGAVDLAAGAETVWAVGAVGNLRAIVGETVTARQVPAAPAGEDRIITAVTATDAGAWLGGYLRGSTWTSNGLAAAFPYVAPAGAADATLHRFDTCVIGAAAGIDGVAVDDRGRPWVGDQAGDGIAGRDGDRWRNVIALATAENDSAGLFDWGANILTMARGGSSLWFGQFTRGALRYTPPADPDGAGDWLLLSPETSPMLGDAFLTLATHPDGVVLMGTDNVTFGGSPNDEYGVDVLIDQDRPRDPASWLHLPPSRLGGNQVRAIAVADPDVVWIAVAGAGLVRWDVNGRSAGPDDPLTWRDTADDHWAGPLTAVDGTDIDLAATQALLPGPDGTLLAGGSGLVQLRYAPALDLATLVDAWKVKDSAFTDGLIGQTVLGLARDRNQDVWALTSAGLNRLRFGEQDVRLDAYTDLETYFTLDPSFYAPSVIVALPGGTYRDLAASATGDLLVLSSDLGAAQVAVPQASGDVSEDADAAYLYPNPFPGETAADRISLGGLDVDAERPVTVEVLNLVGQIVYRSRDLPSAEGFWDGRNRQGRRVASGLYLVKIRHGSQTLVRTLAVSY